MFTFAVEVVTGDRRVFAGTVRADSVTDVFRDITAFPGDLVTVTRLSAG